MTKEERYYRYYQHKADGLCITCSAPAAAPFVRCARHLSEERRRTLERMPPEYRAALRNRALLEDQVPPGATSRLFVTAPGPAIAHCDAWHLVTIPFVCPSCAITLLTEEVPHAPALCE